jgi:hypothetical protein
MLSNFDLVLGHMTIRKEMIDDTKRVIRSRKLKKDRQYNSQKKKNQQLSTKHYTGN